MKFKVMVKSRVSVFVAIRRRHDNAAAEPILVFHYQSAGRNEFSCRNSDCLIISEHRERPSPDLAVASVP